MKIHIDALYQHIYPVQALCVVGILSLLVFIAVDEYRVPKIKAHLTEAFGNATILQKEITLFHSLTGRWPDTGDLEPVVTLFEEDGFDVEVKNGSFKITLNDNSDRFGVLTLAFHRVETPAAEAATAFWVCSPAANSDGMVIHREFETNIEQRYLLSVCKP